MEIRGLIMEIKNKLTEDGGDKLVVKVISETNNIKGYRVGQSLFNNLPKDLADEIRGTELDFFYWANDTMVWETFYKEMVEYE